jgi:hypothetical protein
MLHQQAGKHDRFYRLAKEQFQPTSATLDLAHSSARAILHLTSKYPKLSPHDDDSARTK